MMILRPAAGLLVLIPFLATVAGEAPPAPEPWAVLLDRARDDPALAGEVAALVERARGVLVKPVVVRPYKYDDIEHPDGRCASIPDPVQREIFALAGWDSQGNSRLSSHLPLLACAFRLTGEAAFAERVRTQLTEMTTWSPLQRGGWTQYHQSAKRPKDWKTNPWWGGSWLGTGTGVRAIADALDIMPADEIPAELRAKLHGVLEREIAQICDDWKVKRQWFVKGENPITNQWVMPTEGLIRACLVLGKEQHAQAYELGVGNILKTLEAQNPDGSYAEGWFYAKSWTVPALLTIGRVMARRGDRRVLDHPFMKKFPRWLAHQFQPGKQFVQSFDSIYAVRDTYGQMAGLLSMIAAATGDRDARWLLAHQVGERSVDHWGLAAATLPAVPVDQAPPCFASYDGARAVMWRSSWADDADGLWLRGGHPRDQHDHQDRGHLSYTSKGRPILIETGTPFYGHEAIRSHFQSAAGHNLLQLGDGPMPPNATFGPDFKNPRGWQGPRVVAPVKVARLDATGGDVMVTLTKGYPDFSRWDRRVVWNADGVTVTDTVQLRKPQVVLFRWHLGTAEEVTLDGTTATWTDATLAATSETPLTARQTRRQDHTLVAKQDHHEHACIIVRTKDAVTAATITTTVTPAGQP